MKKNTVIDIKIGEEPAVEMPSEKKAKFAALIEAYKVQNPVKYAQKKEALEAKLNSL